MMNFRKRSYLIESLNIQDKKSKKRTLNLLAQLIEIRGIRISIDPRGLLVSELKNAGKVGAKVNRFYFTNTDIEIPESEAKKFDNFVSLLKEKYSYAQAVKNANELYQFIKNKTDIRFRVDTVNGEFIEPSK